MNDLYLETVELTHCDGETELITECSGCAVPLDIFEGEVIVVSTADDPGERYCDKCAEKEAKAFPGNVHDRREDAEALLRETADTLHEELAAGAFSHPFTATRLSALAARMVRR
jgi:hypothetical protein